MLSRPILIAAALAVFISFAVHAQSEAQVAVPDDSSTAQTEPRDPSVADPAPAHPELKGVLQDFGGMPGLVKLMDDFMAIMMADPRTKPFFENVDRVRVKRELAEQFCVILGGDCTYTGRDMVKTHADLAIDRADFNALVEDLQIAMNRRDIPFRSQNKLLAILAPMHREIINR